MPDGAVQAGIGIKRNPGVVCLWTVSAYKVWRPEVDRGVLFRMSEPSSVEWFARGRPATYQEVDYAMLSGLPLLLELANKDGKDAVRDLEHLYKLARQYMPHEPE
jgi:hypothetical protein